MNLYIAFLACVVVGVLSAIAGYCNGRLNQIDREKPKGEGNGN